MQKRGILKGILKGVLKGILKGVLKGVLEGGLIKWTGPKLNGSALIIDIFIRFSNDWRYSESYFILASIAKTKSQYATVKYLISLFIPL